MKNLDVKIGSEEEVAWKTIKEVAIKEIANNNRSAEINEKIVELATRREKEEREKFKNS